MCPILIRELVLHESDHCGVYICIDILKIYTFYIAVRE
jgi:hypothetical protein